MTIINMEVLDSEYIDCEYYGYSYVARRITLEKENGDISGLMDELRNRVIDAIANHTHSGELASAIAKKNNEATAIEKSIRTAKRKVSDARRAIKEVDVNFDVSLIKEDHIYEQRQTLVALKSEIKDLEKQEQEQLEKERLTCENSEHGIFEDIIDEVISTNNIKYNKLTLSDILNSTVGSTYLYDRLIKDNWSVKTNKGLSINHINLGGHGINANDVVEYKDHDFSVEGSKY